MGSAGIIGFIDATNYPFVQPELDHLGFMGYWAAQYVYYAVAGVAPG